MSTEVSDAEVELIDKEFDRLREFGISLSTIEVGEAWFPNLVTSLVNSTLREYKHLKIGLRKYTGLLAWAARNMLELHIFTRYALASEENTRRFIGDRLIDGIELFSAVRTYALYRDARTDTTAVDETIRIAKEQKIAESINEERYLSTSALAAKLGMLEEFQYMNKVASKLVHPTAWSILAMNDEGEYAHFKPILFFAGARYGSEIQQIIRAHCELHGLRPAP